MFILCRGNASYLFEHLCEIVCTGIAKLLAYLIGFHAALPQKLFGVFYFHKGAEFAEAFSYLPSEKLTEIVTAEAEMLLLPTASSAEST